ncbi:hypothetical protein O3G_MSEX003531 [Manduca sexta]|uniref:Uncharacterized protein n=1 Tax=Manduca sexta TaxID=7130 RepID=A0A922CGK2_MANSE|nr:hypothetical protein O3G_MSEX003531 [Manduca sexta]
MRILVITLWTYFILTECFGINLIELSSDDIKSHTRKHKIHSYTRALIVRSTANGMKRRFINDINSKFLMLRALNEEDKDTNLKNKISTLVQQTLHDTERKIKSVQQLKEKNRHQEPYRAGFILSMIKKTRDVLNELFNVAVKHRDEWKALEQLKIFELIVHTNVDTTNLVRQLVEIHVTHLNATNSRRVVLL